MFTKPKFPILSVLVLLLAANAFGAAGDVDTSFTASAVRTNGSNPGNLSVNTSLLQPDGKILIGGSFTVVGGYARKGIARLNPDGTVDTTFNPPELDKLIYFPTNLTLASTIYGIGLQPDGKILIGGDFTRVNGVFQDRLIRINTDGSPDTAFNVSLHQNLTQFEGTIFDIKILPSGKILLSGDSVGFLTQNFGRIIRPIVRLNADGNYDNSFGSNVNIGMSLRKIFVYPDGRILIAGIGNLSFNFVGLARLNEDGTIDFSFTGVAVKNGSGQFDAAIANDFEVLPNGQILIVGGFSLINGFPHGGIARLNSDGSLDLSFNSNSTGANQRVESIKITTDGKPLIGGAFTTYNSSPKQKIVRLNSDGTPDSTFSYNGNDGTVNELQLLPNNKILIAGEGGNWDRIAVINTDGSAGSPINNLIGLSGLVNDVFIQSDGKILVAGRFESANGTPRNNVARYNSDGTLDTSFNPNVGVSFPYLANRVAVQTDGKILLGTSGAGYGRLNTDGTRDVSFNAVLGGPLHQVLDIAVLPNGQSVCVGVFRTLGDSGDRTIARFNADGTKDNSFTAIAANGWIRKILLQPDGKMLIAGNFTQVAGVNRGRIARLNTDGTHDTTFNPPGGANGTIHDVVFQPDGKIIVVGEFDALNGSAARRYVGRLNSDGSLDTNFSQTADAPIYAVDIQKDGKVLIGGTMRTVGGVSRSGFARLNSDGTIDNTFQTATGANNPVWDIALQTDGNILASGEFSSFDGKSRIGLVRLLNPVAPPRTNFDFDGDGRADVSVFRPSTSRWYEFQSSNSQVVETTFGIVGDVVAPADYDGDGKTDEAIFRPSTGDWWYQSSINNAQVSLHWGASGDIPRPSDFDGDGKADFIVYRPSNSVWYRFGSTGQVSILAFGIAEDKPLVGDFDGDGKSDLAIFRPSTGDWWYAASGTGGQFRAVHWGISTDVPAPADYDGDGKTDFAVFRPSDGGWFILNSGNGSFVTTAFGLSGDKPVPADYDGDGRSDIAVFRPSTGIWYLLQTTSGFGGVQFGISTDAAIPNAFVP